MKYIYAFLALSCLMSAVTNALGIHATNHYVVAMLWLSLMPNFIGQVIE